MPTFAQPWNYSRKTALLEALRRKAESDVYKGAQAQVINKVFGQFTDKQKSDVKAIDEMLNRKEQEAEMYSQRIANEYPSGTSVAGYNSMNTQPYGMPPQTPATPMSGGAEVPIPLVLNPLYREGGLLPKMIPSDLAVKLMNEMK